MQLTAIFAALTLASMMTTAFLFVRAFSVLPPIPKETAAAKYYLNDHGSFAEVSHREAVEINILKWAAAAFAIGFIISMPKDLQRLKHVRSGYQHKYVPIIVNDFPVRQHVIAFGVAFIVFMVFELALGSRLCDFAVKHDLIAGVGAVNVQ